MNKQYLKRYNYFKAKREVIQAKTEIQKDMPVDELLKEVGYE